MSDEHRIGLQHAEITRERRVRALARLGAPVAGLPLIAMGIATWLIDPFLRGALAGLAFMIASLGAVIALLVPPLVAMLARARLGGPLTLTRGRDELALTDARGTVRWRLPTTRLGVAWQRDHARVEIATADGDELVLSFASANDAIRAETMLRRASRDRRAYPLALESDTARLWRTALAWFTPSAMAMVALALGPSAWPAAPLAIALGALGGHGTRRIVFGADGVVVVGRFRRRYVAYRDVERIESARTRFGTWSLAIRLTSGRRISLGSWLNGKRAVLARALLEEGLRMVTRGEQAGASAAALAQEGKDLDEWRRSVESAGRAKGYRGAALDLDRLVSIVRNPAAEASQRIAAALALRADPAGVARIRVAAEVSTEPTVRDALHALANDTIDERRVERALRRLSTARR